MISYIWTPGKDYATQKLFYILTLVLWAFVAPILVISRDPERVKRLAVLIILFSILVSIEALRQFFIFNKTGFISVMGSNYLALGRLMSIATIISLAYVLFWAKKWSYVVLGLGLFLYFFWIILIAGGRGPLIGTIIGCITPLIFSINLRRDKVILQRFTILLFIILIIGFICLVYIWYTDKVTQTLARLKVLLMPGMGDSARLRLEYYNISFRMWMEKPLLGHGIGSFPLFQSGYDTRGYPHNILLEILAELGIIGLILFIGMFFYSLFIFMRREPIRRNPVKLLLIMILIVISFNAMVSGDITDNRLLFSNLGLLPAANEFFCNVKDKKYD